MIDYKFNEGNLIKEFQQYVDKTYSQHYAKEKFQATEFIMDGGHGTGFCIGNVLKYAQRYGKKGTPEDARKDLLKVLHYALMQLYVHDQQQSENKTVEGYDLDEYLDLEIEFDDGAFATIDISGVDYDLARTE
jgi:hypothetical protein